MNDFEITLLKILFLGIANILLIIKSYKILNIENLEDSRKYKNENNE